MLKRITLYYYFFTFGPHFATFHGQTPSHAKPEKSLALPSSSLSFRFAPWLRAMFFFLSPPPCMSQFPFPLHKNRLRQEENNLPQSRSFWVFPHSSSLLCFFASAVRIPARIVNWFPPKSFSFLSFSSVAGSKSQENRAREPIGNSILRLFGLLLLEASGLPGLSLSKKPLATN